MAEQLKNLAHTLLHTTINNSITSVVVTDGSVFPATGNFRITIEDEIMLVTARSSNTLTVTRGAESTTAVGHTAGVDVVHTLTKGGLDTYLGEYISPYIPQTVPIDLRGPRVSSMQGMTVPTIQALTDHDLFGWAFITSEQGKLYGMAHIPHNAVITAQKIVLSIAANATTGVTRLNVATKAIGDGESFNPGSLSDLTAQDVTVPGTAYLRKDVTWTDASETWAPGDLVVVEIFHDGTHTNDTLAVSTYVFAAHLKLVT